MKAKYLTLIAAMAAMTAPAVSASSPKRGVSEDNFMLVNQIKPLEPGVCWYYSWGNIPSAGVNYEVRNYDGPMEFVPMCWNGSFNSDNIRNYVKDHPNVKYLLGFNEPNFTNQANMTPEAAAAKWPEVQALAKELGLKLVAPAMNYSPNPVYSDPTKWFDEFVALVGKDAFDYTAVHSYGGNGVMMDLATKFHDRYGKDVWVTEFCYWPGESQDVYVSPEQQISTMVEGLQWLEKTEWIHRYAWFKATGNHDSSKGPNCALIKTISGYGERELSDQGYVYTYMTDFNPEVWNATETDVNAVDYITSSNILLAPKADPKQAMPIEISRFSAGAYVDYQFDVPEDGDYNLRLTVTGQGEPVRYDPSLKVQLVEGDAVSDLCQTVTFTLPGNYETYTTQDLAISLKAGHNTLRLIDANPYRPSGIHISTVRLVSTTGIADVIADGAAPATLTGVYTLDGRQVRSELDLNGLPAGFYIAGGQKVLVR